MISFNMIQATFAFYNSILFPYLISPFFTSTTLFCRLGTLLKSRASNSSVQAPQHPRSYKQTKCCPENHEWLSQAGREWIIICDDDLAVAHLVNYVACCECERCAAGCVHECFVEAQRSACDRDSSAVADISVGIIVS
jgi:hypothetical protein